MAIFNQRENYRDGNSLQPDSHLGLVIKGSFVDIHVKVESRHLLPPAVSPTVKHPQQYYSP
jgi:hypothetical protein